MTILEVGPGKQFSTWLAACGAALPGDKVLGLPGIYRDDNIAVRENQPGVTFACAVPGQRSVLLQETSHGMPGYSATMSGKGIAVVRADEVTFDGLEFVGGRSKYIANFAGLRHDTTAQGLTIRNCSFRDCDDGILGSEKDDSATAEAEGGDVLIEDTLFERCGHGDGQSHNAYFGRPARLHCRRVISRACRVGHLWKSRARVNIIEDSVFDDADGNPSYLGDFDAGTLILLRNTFRKRSAQNPSRGVFWYIQHDNGPNVIRIEENYFDCMLKRDGHHVVIDNRFVPPGTVWDGKTYREVTGAIRNNRYTGDAGKLSFADEPFKITGPHGITIEANVRVQPIDAAGLG